MRPVYEKFPLAELRALPRDEDRLAEARPEFGKRLRAAIDDSPVTVQAVADALVVERPNFYKVFTGERDVPGSRLLLLPEPVLKSFIEGLARELGYELTPAETAARAGGYKTALDVMREVADVLHSTSDIESGGGDVRRKALDGVREIEEAERALADRKAHLRTLGTAEAQVHPLRGGAKP